MLDHFIGFLDQYIPGFFPGNSSPLMRTLFSDSDHRMKDSIGRISVFNVCQALNTRARARFVLFIGTSDISHAAVLNAELHQASVCAVSQTTAVFNGSCSFCEKRSICAVAVHRERFGRSKSCQSSKDSRCAETLKKISSRKLHHVYDSFRFGVLNNVFSQDSSGSCPS